MFKNFIRRSKMNRKISLFAGKISLVCLAILIGLAACTPAPTPTAAPAAAPAVEATKAPAAAEPAAAAPAAAAAEKKVLAVFMPSADHGFTAESIAQAKSELETLSKEKGFEFKQVTSAEASDQANQVATVLEGKVDTVLLWPIDGAPLRSAAESIVEKKIPLVVYDRLIPDFEPTAQMTGDQITIGTQAAKYMNKYFADQLKTGKVYVLEFQGDNSMAAQERSSSFVAAKDPNLVIAQSFTTNWQRDKGREQMETFLSSSKVEDIEKISAIYTHDDEPMLGILDAIRSYKGEAKLNIKVLTGVGAQKATLDEMQTAKDKDGIDLLSYTYAHGMIRLAVDLAVDTMEGKGKTGKQLVPVEEIRLDNQAEYRKSAEYKHRYEE
jgi:ribose transport system substrate-binding protein